MYEELDNHARLLLYVSGELPEAERERLEQALATDASLRAELEALRETDQSIQSAKAVLESSQPISASDFSAATRQTVRQMRQWQTEHTLRPAIPSPRARKWRMDWRTYSVAAAVAAVMFIGFTVWWINSDHDPDSTPGTEVIALAPEDIGEQLDQIATAFDRTGTPPVAREGTIDQAERAMDDLQALTELTKQRDTDLKDTDSEMQ